MANELMSPSGLLARSHWCAKYYCLQISILELPKTRQTAMHGCDKRFQANRKKYSSIQPIAVTVTGMQIKD